MAPRAIDGLLGEERAWEDHRRMGCWAFHTLHANAMPSAQVYLCDASPDVVMLQELRTDGLPLKAAQREAARSGWALAVEPARVTEAGALSAGVGFAARARLVMTLPEGLGSPPVAASRMIVSHVSAVCRGGVFVVSAYLWCSDGASQRNLA